MQAHTQILLIAASLNKRQNQTFNAPWLTLGMGDRTLGTQLIPNRKWIFDPPWIEVV